MAAPIGRRCYLLSYKASVGINAIPKLAETWGVEVKHLNNTFQLIAAYGTRRTDNKQDVPVQVPVDRLTVSYSRSSGPGGQHVNKVSTKAEVRFNVQTADWISEDVRQKILEMNKKRINKAGELQVTSELSRSQQRNFNDCIQKISAIIAEATERPHEPTTEDIALRAARLDKRNKERLHQKKVHSGIKQSRRVDFD